MPRGAVGMALCALCLGGCTKTDLSLHHASAPITEQRLKRVAADGNAVEAVSLSLQNGTLSGILQPTLACRRVPIRVTKRETLETVRPNWAANAVLIGFGVMATTISGLVYGNASNQSSERDCKGSDFDCLSPRAKQKVWSVGGMLVGATSMTVGGLGLARRPQTRVMGEALPLEVDGQPAGPTLGCFEQEDLAGVDLLLVSQGAAVASTSTDSQGAFGFNVAREGQNQLDVVVESVPAGLSTYVPKGVVVGHYATQLVPIASESSSSTEGKSTP